MTEHRTKKNRMPSQRRRLLSPTILALATTAACLLATTPSTVSAFGNNNHKKVLLKDVQTLTLHQGRMTTGRRTSPVPQIKCVGGNACGDFEPEVVQCTNAGFDGSDVQWKCQADLPDNLRFGQLDVFCEGYTYPDDPYVLKGSCGLEYKLQYTNVRYNTDSNYGRDTWKNPAFNEWTRRAKRQSWVELLYLGTWISVVCFILYSFLKNCFQHYREDARNDDPPPPYRSSGGHGGGGFGGGGGGGGGGGWNPGNQYKPSASSTAETGGFRPGFWSGVGLGGLGAYMATQNRNRRQADANAYAGPSSAYAGTSASSSSWGSSSYGSYSGGSGMGRGSSSSGSSSNPTRTATGFGGTRRR
ncbi:hypothetical protein BKA57DRAFT_411105 [Linnemannia elongata]|nr:hypothetical protein BGZ88_006605 [Linnemannia elongata]KAF9323183.1 hypothetical protein BGZ91_003778 [Linnemannia elongata]KAG0059635.1 hypothetical protein BGZ89_000241 [Linnemannia elongata]KAH7046133.1 hypothetical protein BKA57DRAFT_411105 [Linnemannia elongata]